MFKNFIKKDNNIKISILASISLFISIFLNLNNIIIALSFCSFILSLYLTIISYKRKIIFNSGFKTTILMPLSIFLTILGLLVFLSLKFDQNKDNFSWLNVYNVAVTIIIFVSTINNLMAMSVLKHSLTKLDIQIKNIEIMTNESFEYVEIDFFGNSFLKKNSFKFTKNFVFYKSKTLKVEILYSYMRETGKKLSELFDSDVEIIEMLSI